MRARILTLLGVTIFLSSFSQPNSNLGEKPNGMAYIPAGTFSMKTVEGGATTSTSIAVTAFWMSNEVTNKEYREFVRYIQANPGRFFSMAETQRILIADSVRRMMKDSIVKKNVFIRYSKIADDLIDSTVLERDSAACKGYFSDEKFNDYPVVGVSYRNAVYFCIWKTEMESERLKQEGKPLAPAYRLPTESEWAYAASQPLVARKGVVHCISLSPSKSGLQNIFSLYNLSCNVSEWTSTYPKVRWRKPDVDKDQLNRRVVMGGSWKTSPDINEAQALDPDAKTSSVGFRIVRPVLP